MVGGARSEPPPPAPARPASPREEPPLLPGGSAPRASRPPRPAAAPAPAAGSAARSPRGGALPAHHPRPPAPASVPARHGHRSGRAPPAGATRGPRHPGPGARSPKPRPPRAARGSRPRSFPLLLRPAGEVRRARQMEVAQKRAGSRRAASSNAPDARAVSKAARSTSISSGLSRRSRVPRIASSSPAPGAGRRAPVETAASALLLLLAPEQCHQAVPIHPALAGAGQDREDRETPRLLGVAAQRAAIVEHRHPAERLDVLH